MRVLRLVAPALAFLAVAAPGAGAQQSVPGSGGFFETPLVDVSLSRYDVSTRLGESFSFTSRIRNDSRTTHSGLIAHLNVVGLSAGIYVDPEDWSEERTKDVPSLAPGESATIKWEVTAVTGGDAAIYVAVLPRDGPETFVSPAMDVRIAESKDLNTDGVLPLTLAVPAAIALAALAVRRRRRA